MITLETDRLVLRMLGHEDFEAYAEMHGDPEPKDLASARSILLE